MFLPRMGQRCTGGAVKPGAGLAIRALLVAEFVTAHLATALLSFISLLLAMMRFYAADRPKTAGVMPSQALTDRSIITPLVCLLIFVVFSCFAQPQTGYAAGDEAMTKDDAAKKDVAATQTLSAAEVLLFDTPHMMSVPPGQTLRYKFSRKSQFGDSFEDHIDLNVTPGATNKVRKVSFQFFTGERARPYPPLSYVTANPLLTIYFNRDAWSLARRIKAKGVANYLRNRIVDGLSNVKETQATTCTYQGREVAATRIDFAPFAKDENRHHLVHYSGLEYHIILSNEVPGGVCEIRSLVPFPSEKPPAHFIADMKKSGMMSLAGEAEKLVALEKTEMPLIEEVARFEAIIPTKEPVKEK